MLPAGTPSSFPSHSRLMKQLFAPTLSLLLYLFLYIHHHYNGSDSVSMFFTAYGYSTFSDAKFY